MQSAGHCGRDRYRAAFIGMHIAGQMPVRIEFYVHVGKLRFIEDTPPQHLIRSAFRSELGNHDERLRAPGSSEINQRP
jgi:hypothetical protein